jgi:flagellar basal body-associated protein FliL
MIWNRGITIGTTRATGTIVIIALGIITTMMMIMMIPYFTTVRAQQGNSTEQQQQQDTEFRVQNTTMSIPAPNANLNNQTMPYQIVIALPLRQDGKIWTGTATFTASKPIE